MKKILLFFLVFAAWQMKAQYLGVRAGYNNSVLVGNTTEGASVNNRSGIYAGVTLEFPFSKFFSLQTEAVYSRIGARVYSPVVGKTNLKLDYLSAPVLAKINIYRGLSLHAGPQFNFLLNNSDFSFEKNGVFTPVSEKALDTFDMSLAVGLNYKTNIGWFFEMRFLQGLTNILESGEASLIQTGFSSDYNFKNRVICLGIGYVF
ncbi:porin family protein [Capnocytophaga sp.]|uniref:porin family protein n=1 Tax=Capnocytophaga sp. TaxID=44737 RepID=UPI0026DBD5B7|nr:porin family protein [Capnocytophaga sp.]MDO5104560.1 porin family protein [Capnocytophaga sp.]